MVLTYIEEKIIKNYPIKLKLQNRLITWEIKRLTLTVLWGLLNVSGLFYITKLMIDLDLELIWLAFALLYASCYWIISNIILDKIIGDEIDNL
ncbi:MAG: hypothetical protein K9I95_12010 [Flavobacteriaceae bacterium]|jgi:hypothetical protein|nr:hypothetical protein [Flavobacteriaceae bacterium]